MVRILGVAAVVAVLVQSGSVSIDCKELIRQFDRPIMMVELNGENRPALLDTGASLASIPEMNTRIGSRSCRVPSREFVGSMA